MATDIDPKRVEHLRAELSKKPEIAAAFNELWWESVRERCEELRNDDLRHQALDALDLLVALLRSEDESEDAVPLG